MATRKTFEVDKLRKAVNDRLDEHSDVMEAYVNELIAVRGYTPAQATRLVLATLLERFLFETGNYHGFSYKDDNFGSTDPTKRVYY
jgi:hypothetical protein